ncbi:MAG TPA: LapA family protein [Syntrophales bacterium]|nr:LapA family protein [Syntrophales bacterium]
MKVVYIVLVMLIMLFVITFALQNQTDVVIQYYELFPRVAVAAYMLIFLSFLVGVIFTGFLGVIERFQLNRTITRLNKQIRELRREIRAGEAPPVIEEGTTEQQP